jgi:alpha-tubulin suppressor-like RCC1 family protein
MRFLGAGGKMGFGGGAASDYNIYIGSGMGEFNHGLGITAFRYTYEELPTSEQWIDLDCTTNSTSAIRNDGTLWSWGMGGNSPLTDGASYNHMGLGDDQRVFTPTQVGTADNWTKIRCGQNFSFALNSDGEIWSFGFSYFAGTLGLGGINSTANIPTKVGTANNWTHIDVGGEFSGVVLAINSNGELWGWGDNNNSNCCRLGNGNPTVDYYSPIQVTGSTGWTKIAVGINHSLAIKDGIIYGAGCNTQYELGLGDTSTRTTWTEITGGNFTDIGITRQTSYAIRSDGTLWGWGDGAGFYLSSASQADVPTPTQIGTDSDWSEILTSKSWYPSRGIVIKKTNGSVYGIGGPPTQGAILISYQDQNFYPAVGAPFRIQNTSTALSVLGGSTGFSSDITKAGIGWHHGCIIKGGSIWIVGRNETGQFGNGVDLGKFSRRLLMPGKFKKILNGLDTSHGGSNYFLTKKDGTLWGVGQASNVNNASSFGNDTGVGSNPTTTNKVLYSEPTQISSETFWNDILSFTSFWVSYSAFIKSDGTFWFTGETTINPASSTRTDIWTQYGTANDWSSVSSSNNSVFLTKNNGTLWAYGENSNSELGLGDTTDRFNSGVYQVGTADNWSKVGLGFRYSLGLRSDGTIWSTGWGLYGRLGHGDTTNKVEFTQIGTADNWTDIVVNFESAMALNSNGEIWWWGANTSAGTLANSNQYSPKKFGTDTDWAKIITTNIPNTSYAIKTDNTLYGVIGRVDASQDGEVWIFGDDWSDNASIGSKEVVSIGTVSTDPTRICTVQGNGTNSTTSRSGAMMILK